MNFTTLCYIEKENKYLMLHRTSKKKDGNKDKWIGVGGHFEKGESPEECLLREVKEETGLDLEEVIESKVGNKLYLSPGMTDESVSLVYCTCSGEISTENLEEDEDIETILLSKEDAIKILNSNERCDIKFFMALQNFIINGEEIFK